MTRNTFMQRLSDTPASFKGVRFNVRSDDFAGGRNVVVHEFVQRDAPFVEDLGRKTRRVKFEAWIAASEDNDWNPFTQRDALIAAIEAGGVGQFVTPFWGQLQGHIVDYAIRQQTTEAGGLVVMQLDFVEAGELNFRVSQVSDTASRVTGSAAQAYETAELDFARTYTVQDMPSFVLADASNMLAEFSAQLTGVRRAVSVAAQVAHGNLMAATLLADPYNLARNVTTIVQDLTSLGDLHAFSRPPVPATTPQRAQQAANSNAFVHLVRTAAVVRQAELASELGSASSRYSAESTVQRDTPSLISRQELEGARRLVSERITTELLDLSDLGLFEDSRAALMQLRTDTIAHMTARGETLARTFVTSCCDSTSWWGFMPTLVLAYRWYGVLSDDVINDRNRIPNPLFIEPAARVELLHDIKSVHHVD